MKKALILATGTYADSRINPLKSPVPDAERLRLLLIRPDVGPYEVTMLSDADQRAQRVAIERYFQSADADDTLLLFLSGHGDKDADGDLYFLAQDSDRDLLSSTAIGANFVSRQAARSRAGQKVLLIDTCYSGAFAKGHVFKSASGAISAEDFGDSASSGGGRGTAIITAASSTQLASEADAGGRMQSRFTRHLIEGIETGAADANGTGTITLDELFDYVRGALRKEGPGQEPKRLNAIDGDMVIARNPVRRAAPLAAGLLRKIASRNWESRAGACISLGEILMRGGEPKAAALAALRALVDDPDDRVKRRAQNELTQAGERAAVETAPDTKAAPSPTKAEKTDPPAGPADTTQRLGLLTKPEPDKADATGTDEPPPPKPGLDKGAKIGIALFLVLLLAMLIAAWPGDDSDPVEPIDPPVTPVTPVDPPVEPGPDTTVSTDNSYFGTGSSAYAGYQVTSVTNAALAEQCNNGTTTDTATACNSLGVLVEKGDGGAPDFVVATILYEKACYYGSVLGCANAGMRLTSDAGGVSPDWTRAQTFLNAACSKDDGIGCERRGWLYENRLLPDTAAARTAYDRACTLGISTGCTSRDRLTPSGM